MTVLLWMKGLHAQNQVESPHDVPWVKAIDIRSMSPAMAEESKKVRMRGTVIFNEGGTAVFLQDETAGTLFWTKENAPQPRPGDVVEVEGETRFGLYVPGISNPTYKVIQRGSMPVPLEASYEDLISGRYHYQWVAVEGIIRSVNTSDPKYTLLNLGMGSQVVTIRLSKPPTVDLIDSKVRVTGLASGSVNDRRQLLQPFIWPYDENGIQVLEPAPDISAIPDAMATDILTFRPAGRTTGHRVRMQGTVLASFNDGRLFLRDESAAFGVQLTSPLHIQPGEMITLVGFPALQGFSASLADALIEKSEPGIAPQAIVIDKPSGLNGKYDNELVRLKAEVSESYRNDQGTVLLLHGGKHPLRVQAPLMEDAPLPGSRIQVTGICQVETTTPVSYRFVPESFSVYTRTFVDITVLEAPSWWTAERLTYALFGLTTAMLLAVLWIVLLRAQVDKQTLALTTSIEHKAMLEERQRIAREFHDTLEQELAGLALQLGAAKAKQSSADNHKVAPLLDTADHLVSRIQSETRNLLLDLRTPADQAPDLKTVLQTLADKHPGTTGPKVQLQPDTPFIQLPPRTVHHLRMMAQESVTNAIKHAQAKLISLQVELQNDTLVLSVSDDGKGFDARSETWEKTGHYGCMGMRERARKLGAEVSWISASGNGTQVKIELPLKYLSPST